MKIHRSYYKEYLFFFGTDEQATGEGALGQQVDDLLAANVAVGAMCGFFDEAYTLYFASEFALNNLDYTVEEFVALSQGSFMNVVFPEDRDVVQKALDDSSFEHFEFRMIAKDNTPRWFTGKCTVNVLDDGRRVWVATFRSIQEEHAFKKEMLSKLSHDMFTPLNTILGTADLMASGCTDEKTKNSCYLIYDAATRLMDMVGRAMELHGDTAEMLQNNQPFSLRELVLVTRDQTACRLDKRQQNVEVSIEVEHPNVKSNFSYLNRALRAIIENASTFSPEGSTIVLRARELDSFNQGFGFYEISVSDKGIGIEENDLTRIFEPFVRVKDTRLDDDIPHMGLGLSTAKQLIQSLGGNILVTSELGAGSTFSIRVQLEIDEGEGETSVTDALKGKNVLVVEDNQINREILCEYLEMEGANVVPAKDGQVAYDEFLEREPGFFDIITMDIHMPNMDGYEATRCIRACKEKGGDSVKIIAVTSDTHSEDVRRILSSGMDAHVAKPVDIKALKAAIHTLNAS